MPDLPPFAVSLAGAESAVRDGLAQTLACLQPLYLNADDAGTVELVLAEALNNIVEHALATTTEQTEIVIRGRHCAEGLYLTVIDHGAPMPKGTAPVAKTPDLNVEPTDMPEGGFGWYLIHTLATEVRYARVGTSNHLSLHLPVGI